MYDLNDKAFNNYVKGLCLGGRPIEFYGEKIYHLTVGEILDVGEEEYKRMMLPFMLSKEVVLRDNFADVSMLDILTDKSFDKYLENIISSLKLFFRIEDNDIEVVSFDGLHNEIIIKNRLYINGVMFDELRSILLMMNKLIELKRKDIDEESKYKSVDEDYNKRLSVFYAGKKEYEERKGKDESGSVINLYNLVVHLQNQIDYEGVLKFSIYQLYNSAKNLNIKEDYSFTRRLYSSGQVTLKDLDIPIYYKQILNSDEKTS